MTQKKKIQTMIDDAIEAATPKDRALVAAFMVRYESLSVTARALLMVQIMESEKLRIVKNGHGKGEV